MSDQTTHPPLVTRHLARMKPPHRDSVEYVVLAEDHDRIVTQQAEEIARLRAARSDDAAVVLSLRQELNVSYPDLRAQVQALQTHLSEAQQRIETLTAERDVSRPAPPDAGGTR